MDFGDFELTLREAIFSITIASVLTVLGFIISGHIESTVNDSILKFRQSAQISQSTNEFAHAIRTDVGTAFVYGNFQAKDAVTDSKIGGKHLSIEKTYQEYRHHTRVVTYTVSTGKGKTSTRTRIEHYWTWDTYDSEYLCAKRCIFSGVEFPVSKFDLNCVFEDGKMVANGYHRRIVYHTRPVSFNCTIFSNLSKNTISDNTPIYYEKTIKEAYEYETESHAVAVFWIFWIFLTVCSVVLFVIAENRWLED